MVHAQIAQVALSSTQLGTLRFIHDSDDPVSTAGSSNFAAGWVSGQVASALVQKGMIRRVGANQVVATRAGCETLAQYLRDERR